MLCDRNLFLPTRDLVLHIREAPGAAPAFLFSHGLSSNCLTWEPVARLLHKTGYQVVTVDQRGHGQSQKPASGYDFPDITADMLALLQALELQSPIFVGQSWGGNIGLHLGGTHPDLLGGLAFIDGGFLDMQADPHADWATTKKRLTPPVLAGRHIDDMRVRMQEFHPDWTAEGIDNTLGNFAVDEQGMIAPHLHLNHHMQILRALWDMRPGPYYDKVRVPTLICPALSTADPNGVARKRARVAEAAARIPKTTVVWFDDTDHDIHVQRPARLAQVLLREVREGLWCQP